MHDPVLSKRVAKILKWSRISVLNEEQVGLHCSDMFYKRTNQKLTNHSTL